jgi:hypothetical protein
MVQLLVLQRGRDPFPERFLYYSQAVCNTSQPLSYDNHIPQKSITITLFTSRSSRSSYRIYLFMYLNDSIMKKKLRVLSEQVNQHAGMAFVG